MMSLDLHWGEHATLRERLGAQDYETRVAEYVETLVLAFIRSPEGEAVAIGNEFAGLWSGQFVRLGLSRLGRPPAQLTAQDAATLAGRWFPAEVCLAEPDDAHRILPELLAFWQYLHREHGLEQAAGALDELRALMPDYPERMQDENRFGERKRRFIAGLRSGLDMTDERIYAQCMEESRTEPTESTAPAVAPVAPPARGSPSLRRKPGPSRAAQNRKRMRRLARPAHKRR